MCADEGIGFLCISVGELECTGTHLDYLWQILSSTKVKRGTGKWDFE